MPLAALGVVLAAGYILWMVQRVLYGEVTHEKNAALPDLSGREWAVLLPLVALALFMGVFSPYFTRRIEPSVDCLVLRIQQRAPHQPARAGGEDPMSVDLRPLLPALIVAVTGLVVLVAQAFTPPGKTAPSLRPLAAGPVGRAGGGGPAGRRAGAGLDHRRRLRRRLLRAVPAGLVLVIASVVVLLSPSYLRATGAERGEYYALVLFSVVGMMGLGACLELVSLFVALEIMSVALYALAGLDRDRVESQESAMKYFITGAFSSAFFLYGVALLYGASGSTSLARIAAAVGSAAPATATLALLGAGLLLVGFGFKVASVPFHMWAPDVYEGAPTTVTALMAAGVKAAAFAALSCVCSRPSPPWP